MKYAIISDIHSEYHLLKQCLNSIKSNNIERIICLGDIIGYGTYPNETVNAIIENNIVCVAGNHDKAIFENEAYNFMNHNAKRAIDKNCIQLSAKSKKFLEDLKLNYIEKDLFFVHGMPPNSPYEYLYNFDNNDIRNLKLENYAQNIFFCGHTHRADIIEISKELKIKRIKKISYLFKYILNKSSKYIINVGSVSRPRGSDYKNNYVIYDSSEHNIEFIPI
jgi:predicted phosphodiesterase